MAAKRASKATGALYNVHLFDPEVGSFRHYARMRGTSKADVTRRFLAKWAMSDDLGPSKDDISVVKATPRKKARTIPNPRGVPKDADSLWRIRREVLDSGGYTKGKYPQYFGRGEPLFAVESPEGNVTHIRAYDKEEAIERIRRRDPDAKFIGDRARTKKRIASATTATRPWRITLEYSGNNYGPAKQVHEFVDAVTSDVAIRTARRRHDGARVVTIRPLDIYPIENPSKRSAAKKRGR